MVEEVLTKRCTKCGEVKPIQDFYFNDTEKRVRKSACKFCDRLRWHQYRINHPDKTRAAVHRYRLRHPELFKKQHREQSRHYRLTHLSRVRAIENRCRQKHISALADSYIHDVIIKVYKINIEDITPEMVALEREHLSLMRMIRQKKKEVA